MINNALQLYHPFWIKGGVTVIVTIMALPLGLKISECNQFSPLETETENKIG